MKALDDTLFQCFFPNQRHVTFFLKMMDEPEENDTVPSWNIQPGTQVLCEKRERLGIWQIYVTYLFS